jgi:hypothetical protein
MLPVLRQNLSSMARRDRPFFLSVTTKVLIRVLTPAVRQPT